MTPDELSELVLANTLSITESLENDDYDGWCYHSRDVSYKDTDEDRVTAIRVADIMRRTRPVGEVRDGR